MSGRVKRKKVRERGREREREGERGREREREGERGGRSVCDCACVREREKETVEK